jgi:hypothetical protein
VQVWADLLQVLHALLQVYQCLILGAPPVDIESLVDLVFVWAILSRNVFHDDAQHVVPEFA